MRFSNGLAAAISGRRWRTKRRRSIATTITLIGRKSRPTFPGFDRQYLFQDMRYARAVEMLLKDLAGDVRRPNPLDGHPLDRPDTGGGYFRVALQSGDADQTAALLRATAESGRKFSAVVANADALRSRLAPSGLAFFDDNLRIRARLMVHLNALLHETTLAYLAQPNREARDRRLGAALGFLDAARKELDATRAVDLRSGTTATGCSASRPCARNCSARFPMTTIRAPRTGAGMRCAPGSRPTSSRARETF